MLPWMLVRELFNIAPAFGQDDYNVAKKYDLPILNPVGEDGRYTEGLWAGKSVLMWIWK